MKTYVVYIEKSILQQLADLVKNSQFDFGYFNGLIMTWAQSNQSNICFRIPSDRKDKAKQHLWLLAYARRITIGSITVVLLKSYPLQVALIYAHMQSGSMLSGNMSLVEEEIAKDILNDICYGKVEVELEKLVFDLTPQNFVVECSYEKLFK